jgi:hypothetical protein
MRSNLKENWLMATIIGFLLCSLKFSPQPSFPLGLCGRDDKEGPNKPVNIQNSGPLKKMLLTRPSEEKLVFYQLGPNP